MSRRFVVGFKYFAVSDRQTKMRPTISDNHLTTK